jgi:hypothetical protein
MMQLGAAANLLLGLRPEWTSASGGPWLAPPRQAFVLYDVEVPARAAWQQPSLSLHDGVEDLLDAVFDFRVLPFQADRVPFRIPASALLQRGSLSERFGIELSPDTRYLLVKMRREDAAFVHEGARRGAGRPIQIKTYWTDEGRHAMGRLRTGERIFRGAAREAVVTVRQAQRYLDYCYEFGTHFVSRIVAGDVIVQVFACEPSRYRQIRKTLLREAGATSVSGPFARSFDMFTRPEWITARGRIFSAGGDAELAVADSILAIDPASLPVRHVAPVTIELTPQSAFMEVFRAGVFRRLAGGALLQKYGSRIQLPSSRTELRVPEEFTFPSTARRTDDSLTAFSILLHDTPPIAEKHVAICSYLTSPRAIDGVLPALVLSDEAFDTCELVTREVEGGLFVTNQDGSRRQTLFEGLRFAGDARVELHGDPETPSRDVGPEARRTIDYAETLLRRPSSTREEVIFARGYLEWLAAILTPDRGRLLYLARVAGPWAREEVAIDAAEATAIAGAVVHLAIETKHVMKTDGVAAPLVARLRDVADRVGVMLHVAEPSVVFGQEVAAARARVLRAAEKAGEQAIMDMLSSKPRRLADVYEGDAPICRFSQLVFKIGNSLAATDAVELLAGGSWQRAESLLASLEAPVALPTQRDWEALADVAPGDDELRRALRSLSIAGPWLESRMRRAQRQLDQNAIDTSDDLIAAKWRLIKALAQLEHHLDATPAAKLDLSALAQSLARVRVF